MSKKQDDRNETPDTAELPEQAGQPQAGEQPPDRKISKAQIWTFWCAVAAAVIIARALDYALPGVPESVIERWVMLGFAIFVAVFLYKL